MKKLLIALLTLAVYQHTLAQSIYHERFELTESQMEEDKRAQLKKPVTLHSSCKNINAINAMKPAGTLPAGSQVDLILVSKKTRRTYLFSQNKLIHKFKSTFGKNWDEGHKIKEGDKKTPEGIYTIDYKNYGSKFHNALHVSYPNKADITYANNLGYSPGGDIMIHGLPNRYDNKSDAWGDNYNEKNWTAGCIALNNGDIDKMMSLIKVPTTVAICPL